MDELAQMQFTAADDNRLTTMSRSLLDDKPVMTRAKLLSKTKALSSARSVMHSYLGSAVLRNSTHEMNVYRVELRRLQSETAQRLRSLERSKTQFLMTRYRAMQPILVVSRMPSVDEACCCRTTSWTSAGGRRTRARALADDDFERLGYMKTTSRTVHSAPVKPIIDAFKTLTTRT